MKRPSCSAVALRASAGTWGSRWLARPSVVARFGEIDVMLNIAGYLKPGFADVLPPAEIDRHIDVNVKPLERVVPVPGSGRGTLAKLSNAFPALTKLGLRRTIAQGKKAQVARKPNVR